MLLVKGFPPVIGPGARLLILGSMPGKASLEAQAYYAHKQNIFWRIMGDLFGAGADLPYQQRLDRLKSSGIALWDVMAACERSGSLDANIVAASIRPNDFPGFLAANPGIGRICFNGAAAETSFCRLVLPILPLPSPGLIRLPSTSPAHASLSYADKLAIWAAALGAPN